MGTHAHTTIEGGTMAPNALLVLQCRYCLRVQDGQGWTRFLTFLRSYNLSASDVVLAETYCEPCAAASRQLLTYGPTGHQGSRVSQRDRGT